MPFNRSLVNFIRSLKRSFFRRDKSDNVISFGRVKSGQSYFNAFSDIE